jgi:signal peptidase II
MIWRALMGVVAAAVFVADQKTKALVERRIPDRAVIHVIAGFLNLTNTKNSGAVFGLFSDSPVWWKTPLLIIVSAALLISVMTLVLKSSNVEWRTGVGLALIVGGALSNLYDRMRWGVVEDFLDFYVRNYHWATFNLADTAIVVGTGFIILRVLFVD